MIGRRAKQQKPEEAGRLAGHLTPEQAQELAATKSITVQGADGYRYRLLHEPYGHTTYQLAHDGTPIASWCVAQFTDRAQYEDPDEAVLARKLLIESAGAKALPAGYKSTLGLCHCAACQPAREVAEAAARAQLEHFQRELEEQRARQLAAQARFVPATNWDNNAVIWRWADGTVRQQRR